MEAQAARAWFVAGEWHVFVSILLLLLGGQNLCGWEVPGQAEITVPLPPRH